MKILISAGMEGATGVTRPADVEPGTEQWQRCRRMFTSDVNAAITGVRVNGEPASEGRLNALVAAEYDVPVILVTGDDVTPTVERTGERSVAYTSGTAWDMIRCFKAVTTLISSAIENAYG